MSTEYSVKVGGSTIDSVISNFPEIGGCLAAGVIVRPLPPEVPAIDFRAHRERGLGLAGEAHVRKPGMKR